MSAKMWHSAEAARMARRITEVAQLDHLGRSGVNDVNE
jgi:hypothetical protein